MSLKNQSLMRGLDLLQVLGRLLKHLLCWYIYSFVLPTHSNICVGMCPLHQPNQIPALFHSLISRLDFSDRPLYMNSLKIWSSVITPVHCASRRHLSRCIWSATWTVTNHLWNLQWSGWTFYIVFDTWYIHNPYAFASQSTPLNCRMKQQRWWMHLRMKYVEEKRVIQKICSDTNNSIRTASDTDEIGGSGIFEDANLCTDYVCGIILPR